MLLAVVGVPQFRGHPKIFSRHNTFGNGSGDSLTSLFLVGVDVSLVDASVAVFDSLIHYFFSLFCGDFPGAESDRWHPVSTAEDELGLRVSDLFQTVTDRSVADTPSFEDLSGVVCHRIVDHHKLTWAPSVDTCVVVHKFLKVPDYILWHGSAVSEQGKFTVLFFRSGPPDNLVVEDLVAV